MNEVGSWGWACQMLLEGKTVGVDAVEMRFRKGTGRFLEGRHAVGEWRDDVGFIQAHDFERTDWKVIE